MTMQRAEILALAGALCAVLVAAVRLAPSRPDQAVTVPTSGARERVLPVVGDDSLGSAAANTVANDPFRLANHPAGVRYDARAEAGLGVPAPPPAPRPQLAVRAIVGGPPWQAVVDGLPGQQPGAIVRTGDTFDQLTVRTVGRDTVVIQARDTTWKLTLGQGGP